MKGLGTSKGYGIGKILIYRNAEIKVPRINIEDTELEIKQLDLAIDVAAKGIDKLYNKALISLGESNAEIFSAHKLILKDPEFYKAVNEKITDENVNCEWAVKEVSKYFISLFDGIEDEYLRARVLDIKDVTNRLLRVMLDVKATDLSSIDEVSIIVAEDLTPSDTIQMNKDMVAGIVTELGGRTSHTAIMARTFGMPAITGVKDIVNIAKQGDLIIIDGYTGELIINPNKTELREFEKKKDAASKQKDRLLSIKGQPSVSKDGYKVEIAGNIGSPNEIDVVLENDGEGVGLFRTEFLFMDKDSCPTEEEQFKAYKIAAQKLEGRPLVIRTLDIGGDKELFYLNLPKEMNPFLGYRAIRLCLDQEDIFRVQLRAILRASAYGNIKVMFPMISSISEVRESKAIIEDIKDELRKEDIPFNEDMEIGIMVEIPAVAIHSRSFAKEVDFFSIGTNDLIQYTLAVDRGNQKISKLYSQYHPAVLNLIKLTIDNAHQEGIWVGMCGEVAGDEKLIPLLLAMGLDEFSMSASSILKARSIIRNTSKEEVATHMDTILNLATAEDVEEYLDRNITKK